MRCERVYMILFRIVVINPAFSHHRSSFLWSVKYYELSITVCRPRCWFSRSVFIILRFVAE